MLALPVQPALLTQAPPVVQSSTAAGPIEEADRASGAASDDSDDESYASSSEPLFEDISSRLGSQAGAASKLGSFASTYWRPERQDRKENLSVIDERYPALHVPPLLIPPLLVPSHACTSSACMFPACVSPAHTLSALSTLQVAGAERVTRLAYLCKGLTRLTCVGL